MIKAVFFDAIKTLFAPYPTEIGLYQKVIKDILDKDIPADVLGPILETAMAETEKLDSVKSNSMQQWSYYPAKVAEMIGCPKDACEDVGEQLRYETWGNYHNYRLYDDVVPAIKLVKDRRLYIACVSNEDGWLGDFFKHFEIDGDFSYILTSDEAGVEKPNPAIFERALSETGFKPHEVLFVGDSLISDYFGAAAVGMKSVLIDRGHKTDDDSIVKIDDLRKIGEYL